MVTASSQTQAEMRSRVSGMAELAALCAYCAHTQVAGGYIGHLHFSVKLQLNAIKTYSQVAGRGAIYKSLMIATGPANDKIYTRCVNLIAKQIGITIKYAELALIKSIYSMDVISDDLMKKSRSLAI